MISSCIIWPHGKNRCGYGITHDALAHRLAWAEAYGPIPAGLHVLHKCDNPPCVNPEHLFLGTHADNMADMRLKGRRKGRCNGSAHGRAKLTEADIPTIRAMLAFGCSSSMIARSFGVSAAAVCFIRDAKHWRHVP